jgi:hypothetical protein
MPKLSKRVARAARTAGVFREVSDPEQLHVWGKKRFIESYLACESLEQDQCLLPDKGLKNLLSRCAEAKALPTSQVTFNELHKRGLRYAEQIRKAAPLLVVNRAVAARRSLFGSEEERKMALRALHEKETDPAIADRIRAQKAALLRRDSSSRRVWTLFQNLCCSLS